MRPLLLFFTLFLAGEGFSQCIKPDFILNANACLYQNVTVANNTNPGAYEYKWDFCSGDLGTSPSIHTSLVNSSFFRARSLRFVNEESFWYGFAISATGNNLMRLDFGRDLQSTPTLTNIGTLGGSLSGAFSFDVIQEEGVLHIFAANTQSRNIVRFSFDNGITSVPSVHILQTPTAFDQAAPNFIRMVRDTGHFYAFVSVGGSLSDTKIVRLDMGQSVLTTSPIITDFTVSGSSQLRGLSFVKECGQWVGFALSTNTNSLYRLIFDNGLQNSPQSSLINTGLALNTPVNIEVHKEGGVYYGLIQNSRIEAANAAFYRITLGSSPTGNVVNSDRFQWEELSGGAYALAVVEDSSSWYSFTFNLASQSLLRMEFSEDCPASIPVMYSQQPDLVQYSKAGDYKVTLDVKDMEGSIYTKSDTITVSSLSAPAIDFRSENVCSGHDINFSSIHSGDVKSFNWDFGDGNSSSSTDPSHRYLSAGTFIVSLSMSATNECNNSIEKSLKVFDEPVGGFVLPTNLICTNDVSIFPTTTPDIYDGNLSYQWFVDNNPVSTERDLEYTFTTSGHKEIKLKTSIPGCSDEITKTTSPVQPGPVVDFSFTGICEDEMFSFQNETSDAVESLTWDFGNGQTSTEINPSTYFTESGDFTVSLTATNTIGCENVSTKALSVRSVPMVDFTVNEPPNACSGVNTLLQNATVNPDGAAITEWLWDPGDGSAPVSQTTPDAQHVFANGGSYPVSLTAITEHGCVGTVDKTVIIEQAPATTFTFTPACDDIPVNFTGPGGDDISSLYWEIGTSYYDGPQPTHTFRSPGNYPVYLEVSGWNGCIATRESIIHVPEPLAPDFSVLRNCVGDEAILTDITDGVEPVLSSQWEFSNGNVFTSSPLLHSFHSPGSENVTLRVTTASGCVYAVTKPVQVLPQPVAAFSADPDNGAWPLIVSFTNTSSNATQYLWEFADGTGSTSSETSPVYTFLSTGTFPVKLTASNAQQCESNVIVNIPVIAPLPDADIALLTLSPNADGSLKLIATIHNKGNTVIRDLPMDIDLSGKLSLRHIVDGPILPGAKYNAVLGTDILNPQDLQYVCASIDLQNDLNPALNKACEELTAQLFIFPAYPNPVSGDLNLEWISRGQHLLTIRLTDAMGRYVYSAEIDGIAGFNHRVLDLSGIRNGVYVLSIGEGGSTRSERITILGKP